MASLRDSLIRKQHILSRVAGTDTSPGFYTVSLQQSIQIAGALNEMSEISKSAILTEYLTYTAAVEDLVNRVREESLALISMIFSVEGQNDPETVASLVKEFSEEARGCIAKGTATLNVLSKDVAPLRAPLPPATVPLLAGGKKTQAKHPMCGRCGDKTGKHATKDCKYPRCSYCNRWWHVAEYCWWNPNSAKYRPEWAARHPLRTGVATAPPLDGAASLLAGGSVQQRAAVAGPTPRLDYSLSQDGEFCSLAQLSIDSGCTIATSVKTHGSVTEVQLREEDVLLLENLPPVRTNPPVDSDDTGQKGRQICDDQLTDYPLIILDEGTRPVRVVENQLNRAEGLNTEIIADGNLIKDAEQSANNLLASMDDSQLCREEGAIIEKIPAELLQRYDALRVIMAERCADLDSALVACKGVQDALANITSWLSRTDKPLAQLMEPTSLIRDRLNGKLRHLKVLQDDVIYHEPEIQKMCESAQQFIQISSDTTQTQNFQQKEMVFNEISTTLKVFTKQVESFDIWYSDTIDFLESIELLQMDADEYAQEIGDRMVPHFDRIIRNGQCLTNKEDTTGKGPCIGMVWELEGKWNKLVDILGKRRESTRAGKQSLNASEPFRGHMYVWLQRMEQRVKALKPLAKYMPNYAVAVDSHFTHTQRETISDQRDKSSRKIVLHSTKTSEM